MKKLIIILSAALIFAGIAAYFFLHQSHRKVSDFAIFPCEFNKATQIDITDSSRHVIFKKENGHWMISAPVSEPMDSNAEYALNSFLHSKLFIDEKREVTESEKSDLAVPSPTFLKFSQAEKTLCELELGHGYKLPTVDSERKWVFQGPKAYRVFIPLMDFGPLFEQPTIGWRNRIWLQLSTNDTQALEYWSGEDHFRMERTGARSGENPQGWQLISGETPEGPTNLSTYELDYSRVATIINLITPLVVDDWADKLSDQEKSELKFGGKITIETQDDKHNIYIGEEADLTAHPEWSWLKEGTRYFRLDEDKKVGLIDIQHLLGLYPSLNDMRSPRVWKLDTTHFSGIEVSSGEICLRYGPSEGDFWSVQSCLNAAEKIEETPLKPTVLGNYLKALTALEAFRYATDAERRSTETNTAEIRIYEERPDNLTWRLNLSDIRTSHFRYARVTQITSDGNETSGPLFVISESISRLLLEDLRTRR